MTYYNENDRFAAQWLRNLMDAGHIGQGDVDDRPIQEVRAADLAGYERCHFFAGIAGWDYALKLAGWPDGWVADAERYGQSAVLESGGKENEGRVQQSQGLRPAGGVADAGDAERGAISVSGQDGRDGPYSRRTQTHSQPRTRRQVQRGVVWTGSCPCQPFSVAGKRRGAADDRHLWPVWRSLIAERRPTTIFGEQVASKDGRAWLAGVRADLEAMGYAVGAADLCAAGVGAPHIRQRLWWVAHSEVNGRQQGRTKSERRESAAGCGTERVADPERRPAERYGHEMAGTPECVSSSVGQQRVRNDHWDGGTVIDCLDGVSRRTQPGIHPLAVGVPGRVGRLRAYGNAIVPQVAAEFVKAFMDATRGAGADAL